MFNEDCSVQSCNSIKQQYDSQDNSSGFSIDIVINITSHKKMSTYMETFVIYNIDTSGSNGSFSVARRYGDFEWLSQTLMERYPMAIIPPLPQKHNVTTIERFIGDFIDKRQTALCLFLRRLIAHPIVGLDNEIWRFLSLSSLGFLEHKRANPVLGKLETILQSLNNLSVGSDVHGGGCVDTLYKAELEKSVNNTAHIAFLVRGLERIVLRSVDCWINIGHTAEKGGSDLKGWTALNDVSGQYVTTGEAVQNRLLPWVTEYGLYCTQAEKAARRRKSVESKFTAHQSKVAQGRISVSDNVKTSHHLHDTLSQSNADLKSEYDRWQAQRKCETKTWLSTFADIHLDHYERTVDIWRQFMSGLHLVGEEDLR